MFLILIKPQRWSEKEKEAGRHRKPCPPICKHHDINRKRKGGGGDEKFVHRFERIDQKEAGAMAWNATLALELICC
jgi:hypothetical protein